MTKFREYFDLMLEKNPDLFKHFGAVHNAYVLDPKANQDEFNAVGAEVQEVIIEFENRLCHHSEKGVYAKFSHQMSDKFWELVRDKYPKIDDVGIEISYVDDNLPLPPVTRAKVYQRPKPRPLLDQSADEIIRDTLDETLGSLKKTTL